MILVIGATGTTGSALLQLLAETDTPARALVRPVAITSGQRPPPIVAPSIEHVRGDASDSASLRRVLCDVTKLYLAMGNGPQQREIELLVVQEAKRAGVEHIVKLSAPIVGPTVPVAIARMHFEVEQAIEVSGMDYTHLRPFAFMQNLFSLLPTIHKFGLFFGRCGDAPLNFVDARDIAAVAMHALTKPGSEGRAYQLTGPDAMSYRDVANRISALGRPVTYVDQSPEKFRAGLERAKHPAWLVAHLLEIQELTLAQPESPTSTVADLLGRQPRSLNAFLTENRDRFLGPRSITRLALRLLPISRSQPRYSQ